MAERHAIPSDPSIEQQLKELAQKIDILHDAIERQQRGPVPSIPGFARVRKAFVSGREQVEANVQRVLGSVRSVGRSFGIGRVAKSQH